MHFVGEIRDHSYNSLTTDKRIWLLLKLHDAKVKNRPGIKTNHQRGAIASRVNINRANPSDFIPSLH